MPGLKVTKPKHSLVDFFSSLYFVLRSVFVPISIPKYSNSDLIPSNYQVSLLVMSFCVPKYSFKTIDFFFFVELRSVFNVNFHF